ncbi:hypothetical protein Voc01_044210 [Virgisporangium ochraceum]|uniref:Flagellar hook-length control protein FliK n=2 Tax=Virgisporangium ochraceum TaxID=65505 RepID=A0A8J4ECD1_9ACTN|nr:hypothetical protein Voc01_044210 [Virgisporangium ochraceum]
MRRLLGAASAVVLAVAGGAAFAAPAAHAAGTAGYCPDANGVTVVVDFNDLGGGVVVRCAPGDQATGLSALKNAGFTIAGTTRWGEGFVCRIEGRPTVATEPCRDTPPASAYWSYWHASNGGSWTYSDKGVQNRRPPAGSFEGWSFSTNRTQATAPRPDTAPTRPAAPAPPQQPPPANGGGAPPAQAPPGAAQPGVPAPPGAPGAPGVSGAPPASGDATPSGVATPSVGTGASGGAGAAPFGSPSAEAPVTDVATTPTGSSGMPVGTLAGLGLLLAFAVAAGVTVWRRRSAGPPADPFADPGED